MTTINRATWTDDDGSGMTGTILNNARLQSDIYDKVDGALATLDTKDASQDTAIAANGPHSILSAQHPDTTPAALVAGDVLFVNATGKLVRLPKGADGSVLGLTGGLPGWAPAGQWVTVAIGSITMSAGTGTWTIGTGTFFYQYALIGKIAFLNIVITGSTTSAATAYVRLTLPAAIVPAAANANYLATIYPGATLAATCASLSNAAGGLLTILPNVAGSGTIPAVTNNLNVNVSLTYALP